MKTLIDFIDYSNTTELQTIITTLQVVYDMSKDKETKAKLNIARAIAILRQNSLEEGE